MLKNKIKIIASIAIVGIVAGSIFYACKKDEVLTTKTEDVSAVKQQKDLYGVWVTMNISNLEPTGKISISGYDMCTKVVTEKLLDRATGRYSIIKTTTYIVDCITGRIYFGLVVEQNSKTSIPPDLWNEESYKVIDNFDFYVNDQFVTADFNYVKPIEIVGVDGEVIRGEYSIMYDDIVQLFHRINEYGNWMK